MLVDTVDLIALYMHLLYYYYIYDLLVMKQTAKDAAMSQVFKRILVPALQVGNKVSNDIGTGAGKLAGDIGIGKTGQYVVNKLVRAGVDNYTGISFGDVAGAGPAGALAYFKAGGGTSAGPGMVKGAIAGGKAAGLAMLGPVGAVIGLLDGGKSSRPKTATAYAPGWGPNGRIKATGPVPDVRGGFALRPPNPAHPQIPADPTQSTIGRKRPRAPSPVHAVSVPPVPEKSHGNSRHGMPSGVSGGGGGF
jgi:hypothetical protein